MSRIRPADQRLQKGGRYEVTVPDSLDLAYHAELAINNVTGSIRSDLDYEYIWCVHLSPFRIVNHACQWFSSNAQAIEVLSLMRTITGSDTNLDLEQKMIASYLSRLGKGDLIYNAPYRDDAPWRNGGAEYARKGKWRTDEDVTQIIANALVAIGLMERSQRDDDPAMLEIARKLIYGLVDIAIDRGDYAYYPANSQRGYQEGGLEFAYYRNSGWPNTREAEDEADCAEGTVAAYIAIVIRAMSRYCALTGDEKVLATARKLVNYILKPQFWIGHIERWGDEDRHGRKMVWGGHGGAVRKPAAHFKGHQSGITYTLEALSDYALVANDASVKEFVRQGYEYMRNLGLAPIGMWGENIANGYMAMIAIKLSDSGIGEYWEDVDRYIRNAIVEDQFTDAKMLRKLCEERGHVPTQEDGYTIERFIGGLRHHGLIDRRGTLDPTQNGTDVAGPYHEHFYAVWESIVRCQDGMARINLLLNRASSWLDVHSHLPYEGKVVIKNKTAHTVAARIPAWVDKVQVRCDVDGSEAPFHWLGNYVVMQDLKGKEIITLEFPMVETTEEYFLTGFSGDWQWYQNKKRYPRYILHFKGNTCLKVEFPNRNLFFAKGLADEGYPVYQRKHYRGSKAPMKNVVHYVAPRLAAW